ncbi:hypothetical protein FWC63_03090 [Candidatus Saccharibacteria bacterium]|nr:hypothetical protein [Candidatus Saccharibacteria bacterium]
MYCKLFIVNLLLVFILVVFIIALFAQRDRRSRTDLERASARRVALTIRRHLNTEPLPGIQVLRDQLEHLYDTLHVSLNDNVRRDIEVFLHTTIDDAAGTDPDGTTFNEIEVLAKALERRYGEEIFTTLASEKQKR